MHGVSEHAELHPRAVCACMQSSSSFVGSRPQQRQNRQHAAISNAIRQRCPPRRRCRERKRAAVISHAERTTNNKQQTGRGENADATKHVSFDGQVILNSCRRIYDMMMWGLGPEAVLHPPEERGTIVARRGSEYKSIQRQTPIEDMCVNTILCVIIVHI